MDGFPWDSASRTCTKIWRPSLTLVRRNSILYDAEAEPTDFLKTAMLHNMNRRPKGIQLLFETVYETINEVPRSTGLTCEKPAMWCTTYYQLFSKMSYLYLQQINMQVCEVCRAANNPSGKRRPAVLEQVQCFIPLFPLGLLSIGSF